MPSGRRAPASRWWRMSKECRGPSRATGVTPREASTRCRRPAGRPRERARAGCVGGDVMPAHMVQPEFRVKVDAERCRKCGRCVQQCGWGVFSFAERPIPDHAGCRACHRCVTFCPAQAITIEKNPLAYRENPAWPVALRKAIWRQADTAGVLLTGMGNDLPYRERLRPPRARRLPGHQPVHRPAARAHGAAHLPGRQAGQGGG